MLYQSYVGVHEVSWRILVEKSSCLGSVQFLHEAADSPPCPRGQSAVQNFQPHQKLRYLCSSLPIGRRTVRSSGPDGPPLGRDFGQRLPRLCTLGYFGRRTVHRCPSIFHPGLSRNLCFPSFHRRTVRSSEPDGPPLRKIFGQELPRPSIVGDFGRRAVRHSWTGQSALLSKFHQSLSRNLSFLPLHRRTVRRSRPDGPHSVPVLSQISGRDFL